MRIPTIQIHQKPARLGMDAELAKLEIRQPRPQFEMRTSAAKLSIEQPAGEMQIDSTRAWDALARGGSLHVMHSIYSAASQVALEGIARIVERGNRLAAIQYGGNAIADIAQEEAFRVYELNFVGEAAYDNVDIHYAANRPKVDVALGDATVDSRPNLPEITYHRGKLDIYMRQYAEIAITPPQIDLTV